MFSRGGFDAKAVAIYKQILRTEEDSLEARTHLGECFQRMGLTSDALREFQEAFKICQKKELKREAFEKWRTGYSSAFAIVLFVTVFGLANIYVKALNRVKNR